MKATFQAELQCSRCKAGLSVELFQSLHVSRMPERRAAILAGRFSVFVCHQCQGRTRIEPTMLYTDFDRWSWYGVFPQTAIRHRSALAAQVAQLFHHNIELAAAPLVKSWAPNFKRRTVFGLASLRDKLLCEDHGLDDRALEVVKWQVIRTSAPTAIDPVSEVHLDQVLEDRLVIRVEPPPGPDGTVVGRLIAVPRTRLADAAELVVKFHQDGEVVDWRAPLWPDEPLPPGDPGIPGMEAP